MTKADFIKAIKETLEETSEFRATLSQAGAILDAVGAAAACMLGKGERVPLPGLGILKTAKRAARKGRNPKTGSIVEIPARRVARFVPCKALKEAVK